MAFSGSASTAIADVHPLCLVVERLKRDRFAHEANPADVIDRAYRAGWNACANHHLEWIEPQAGRAAVLRGLAELRAFDVDTIDENGAGDA